MVMSVRRFQCATAGGSIQGTFQQVSCSTPIILGTFRADPYYIGDLSRRPYYIGDLSKSRTCRRKFVSLGGVATRRLARRNLCGRLRIPSSLPVPSQALAFSQRSCRAARQRHASAGARCALATRRPTHSRCALAQATGASSHSKWRKGDSNVQVLRTSPAFCTTYHTSWFLVAVRKATRNFMGCYSHCPSSRPYK